MAHILVITGIKDITVRPLEAFEQPLSESSDCSLKKKIFRLYVFKYHPNFLESGFVIDLVACCSSSSAGLAPVHLRPKHSKEHL